MGNNVVLERVEQGHHSLRNNSYLLLNVIKSKAKLCEDFLNVINLFTQ